MAILDLREQLLDAWIRLKGLFKDSRVIQDLTYNEAVVMRMAYNQYREDGLGRVAVRSILKETGMLKSQVNRTVDSLCSRGFLVKERDEKDHRSLFVRPVPENLSAFVPIHERSLQIAEQITHIIGEADAAVFIRCCEKLSAANIAL